MTGLDLKLRRVAADVKGKDLAAVMGVSGAHLSRIENSRIVSTDTIERYISGLATFTTNTTPEAATA